MWTKFTPRTPSGNTFGTSVCTTKIRFNELKPFFNYYFWYFLWQSNFCFLSYYYDLISHVSGFLDVSEFAVMRLNERCIFFFDNPSSLLSVPSVMIYHLILYTRCLQASQFSTDRITSSHDNPVSISSCGPRNFMDYVRFSFARPYYSHWLSFALWDHI